MSDIFGELRSIFASKVLPWVLPFKKTDDVGHFDAALAHALAQVEDPIVYDKAWQYLCGHARTRHINLANVQLLVDVHPCRNVFTLEHFLWLEEPLGRPIWHTFHNNDQQFSYLGDEGIQIRKHEAFLGLREEFSGFRTRAVRSHWQDEPATDTLQSIKMAYANYCLVAPYNNYRGYHEWIKQGYKPSQYGLIPPEDVRDILSESFVFPDDDYPPLHIALSTASTPAFLVRLMPEFRELTDLANDYAQLNNGTIDFTLDLRNKKASIEEFKCYLNTLWEQQDTETHPLSMASPPRHPLRRVGRRHNHENRQAGP